MVGIFVFVWIDIYLCSAIKYFDVSSYAQKRRLVGTIHLFLTLQNNRVGQFFWNLIKPFLTNRGHVNHQDIMTFDGKKNCFRV